MKYSSCVAALMAFAMFPSSVFAQTSSTLEEKWAINDEPTFTYESLDFTLTFLISDFIVKGQAGYEIYTEGCKEEGEAAGPGIVDGTFTDTPNTDSNTAVVTLDQPVILAMSVDPDVITTDPDLYSEDTALDGVTAQIRFCVRFFLNTPSGGATPIEVNFLETIVTLDVDLSAGFTIAAVAVEPRDKLVRTAAQAYEVEGYLCGTDLNEYAEDDPEADAVRNQGALIRVCVRPNADARGDGVFMRAIDVFTWRREDPVVLTQEAVKDREASTNALTALFCNEGDLVCYFESILFAAFYTELGTVAGQGTASMQFGGNGDSIDANGQLVKAQRRALRESSTKGRHLQDGEEAATSEFDLSIDVNEGTAPTYTDNSGVGSIAGVSTMAMALIGLVGVVAI
jgi:hypothetical protein